MSDAGSPHRSSGFGTTLQEVRHGIAADLQVAMRMSRRIGAHDRLSSIRAISLLVSPPLLCCVLFRVSRWMYCGQWSRTAGVLAWCNRVLHRADISPSSAIGPGLYLPHTSGVVFRGNAGAHLTLYARCAVVGSHFDSRAGHVGPDCPDIGDHVTVGAHSLVAGPVRIGSDSVIGASTVVCDNVGTRLSVTGTRLISQLRRVTNHTGEREGSV